MRTRRVSEVINQDRRQLSVTTAMGIAAADAASLFPAHSAPASEWVLDNPTDLQEEPTMTRHTYDKEIAALLVIDPYNDFISEGGKLWNRIRAVAEANDCVPHMLQVLNAARKAKLRVFYAMHHRYRPGDYETWKYIAPIQKAAWKSKAFEYGAWGGEIRPEFEPKPGESRRRKGGGVRRSAMI